MTIIFFANHLKHSQVMNFGVCPMDFQPISAQQLPTVYSKETQTAYILNKSEVSKVFETITVGVIHKIYIIYVVFDIKENKNKQKD